MHIVHIAINKVSRNLHQVSPLQSSFVHSVTIKTADTDTLLVKSKDSIQGYIALSFVLCMSHLRTYIFKNLYFPTESSSTNCWKLSKIWEIRGWNQRGGRIAIGNCFVSIWGRRERKTEIKIYVSNSEQNRLVPITYFVFSLFRGALLKSTQCKKLAPYALQFTY